MNSAELREQLTSSLLEGVQQTQYPSVTMLDRVEEALETPEQLADYAEVLVDKVSDSRYPGIPMLDRVNGVLMRLEQLERQEQLRERARRSDEQSG
jgi:hypothetical protein